ncbi:MAG: DUF1592 domain-containing protein [Planctomycetaceae bacterium]|nr:DUF1592 domain-containing protein [Planctomycetaceae bacterium]
MPHPVVSSRPAAMRAAFLPIIRAVLLVGLALLIPAPTTKTGFAAQDESHLHAWQNLTKYCNDCHTGDSAEGGIRLDVFDPADGDLRQRVSSQIELIEKVLLVLKEQQMPPADMEQPSAQERVALVEWYDGLLQNFDFGNANRPGRVTVRRLNRAEYNNTIRDLTGLELRLADSFPSDDVGNGFDNIGDVLTLPPILMEKYLESAQRIADEVLKNPDAFARVFPLKPKDPQNLEEAALVAFQNANNFAARAFRRPVTEDEATRLRGLMTRAWEADVAPPEIMGTVITAVLASPNFLYRVEDDAASAAVDGVRPLNDYELATRLAYFLWSSMPDETLFELARRGELRTSDQLAAQVPRMLADPKARALVDNFAGQWLQLRDLDNLSPDPDLFKGFDDELRRAMRRETELVFWRIVSENRSVLELLDADYTYVNSRLARHYGLEENPSIANHADDGWKLVPAIGMRRGILMHSSILLLTSNPTRTSPVKRGKWILDNLLAEPPPPAPPNVPELGEGQEALGSLRQRMEQHRADPNCAVCHTKMDALGFGLENFDVIGAWRESDGAEKIDSTGELPGGKSFQNPVELVQILTEDKSKEFVRCMTSKLLTFSLGRGLGVTDRVHVRRISEQVQADQHRFHTMVQAIVTSPPFMYQEVSR